MTITDITSNSILQRGCLGATLLFSTLSYYNPCITSAFLAYSATLCGKQCLSTSVLANFTRQENQAVFPGFC